MEVKGLKASAKLYREDCFAVAKEGCSRSSDEAGAEPMAVTMKCIPLFRLSLTTRKTTRRFSQGQYSCDKTLLTVYGW